MTYPTEVVAKAKHEISIFERPSVDTSKELIAEVLMLRSLVREMRAATNKVVEAYITEEVIPFNDLHRLAVVIDESKVSVSNKAWS